MATDTAAPAKRGKMGLVIWILLAIIAAGGGAALPWFLINRTADAHGGKKPESHVPKHVAIPFEDVTVNLVEDRLTRFLRVKLMIAVEESDAREVTELVTKQKPFLKNSLITHLSDQSPQEVIRKVGVNRMRREIRDQFNLILFPSGEEKIVDILFDTFLVQ